MFSSPELFAKMEKCRSGGIAIHDGFKIHCSKEHEGWTPSSGTFLCPELDYLIKISNGR